MKKTKWYQKKKVYIPVSIIGGLVGMAWISSLLGVSIDDEFNSDYYKKKDTPLFKKKAE